MKRITTLIGVCGVVALSCGAHARVITVTTTQNVNPPAGQTSLLQALSGLQEADVVQFNIPGAGPHVIVTPLGGYPVITANNITIDGYTQPGSAPNSNPILGGNNAQIKIVLDSTGDESAGDPSKPDRRSTRLPFPGYGDSENCILGVHAALNFKVRGLCFLGRHTEGSDADPSIYCVALEKGARGAKVQGCWFGLAPDGTTVKGCSAAVAAFRHRVNVGGVNVDTFSGGLVFGTDGDGQDDVAEFNISMAMRIALALEAPDVRVSGNYFNVYPSGKQFLDVEALYAEVLPLGVDTIETFENGRVTDNTIIGTDGNGISDANERNIFGHSIYDHDIEFYSSANNAVIAGNYFGVGVDGVTTAPIPTSATPDLIEGPGGNASIRVGTDGDGKSDGLEGNLIAVVPGNRFVVAGNSVPIVARRNKMMNNNFGGFPFADGEGGRAYDVYYASTFADVTAGVVPVIESVTAGIMTGTLPAPNLTTYAKSVVDIYVVDPAAAALALTHPGTWAGSFVDNGTLDLNPAANAFRVSLIGLPIPVGSQVALAVTYYNQTSTEATNAITGPISAAVEANIPAYTPATVESVGLRRIVHDTVVINQDNDALGNWEPYASVLGTTTFLIEGNAFAEGTADRQRFVVALQPADGKPMKRVEGFYADNGTPFDGPINLSRQNGNPGRVAGDKRPGAVNYLVGAEASPHGLPEFGSDARWTLGFNRLLDGRYATVQSYSLDPATLAVTPTMKALDAINGRLTSGTPPDSQIGRFGGDIAGLDNGNFAVVAHDRSRVRNPAGDAATAVILKPDGTVVKDSFMIEGRDIWSNVAAFKGGFCARVHENLWFFDNDGNLLGMVTQDISGESYDTGRGDGTRIAGHINSPYIFLAGKVRTSNTVKVSVFDARTRTFVANADVSEPAFPGTPDRVNVTVDALNNVVVGWESLPEGYEVNQVAVRVLKLNEAAGTVTAVTPSFFAFENAAPSGGIHTFRMSVAMTTKAIMVSAKGEINLENKPELGATSPKEVNFFTVFSHPNPADDPTTPVGGGTPTIGISRIAGGQLQLEWTGQLQSSDRVTGGWANEAGTSPKPITPSQAMKFWRSTR